MDYVLTERYTDWIQLHFHELYAIMQQNITYTNFFKRQKPKDQNEPLALGHTLKMIHFGANKNISSKTIFESYFTSRTQKEQHDYTNH